MIESAKKESSTLFKLFGYNSKLKEPRLFGLPYSRELHEQLEKDVMPQLKRGQPVYGSLKKSGDKAGKRGTSKGDPKTKGDGSESQEQRWEFHQLRPSDFLQKPDR